VSLAKTLSALLFILIKPSPAPVGEVMTESVVAPAALVGVRSFQAATIFRTELNGDRGEAWGRRRDDMVGVAVKVSVGVPVNVLDGEIVEAMLDVVAEKVLVNVPVSTPGLR
jgi:hypothetical protein